MGTGRGVLLHLRLARDFRVLGVEHLVATEVIEGAMLRSCHQPCRRIARDSRRGPLFQGRDESILREVFGEANVADNARETCDQLCGLDAPYRFDRAIRVSHESSAQRALRAACSAIRFSCSRSSGVNASPKSSASWTWRISISASVPGIGFGQ